MNKNDLKILCDKARAVLPLIFDCKTREKMLISVNKSLLSHKDTIISENKKDIENARLSGLSEAMIDRLTIDEKRLENAAASVFSVNSLPDPLFEESEHVCDNDLIIKKLRVPLGVIAMIYESRPNVTVDAAALCLKSGNAVILRGGKEAINTNIALADAIAEALSPFGAENAVTLIKDTSRDTVSEMLTMRGDIDLVIPRGGKGLIRNVTDNSKVPVIETGAGNCHVYVHESADIEMAVNIILNAKVSRPSVCNAAETLLVDSKIAPAFLPLAAKALSEKNVEIRACRKSMEYIPYAIPANDEDYYCEFNDYILAVKTVSDYKEAVDHINKYSTKHSEAIVSRNGEATEYFMNNVDSAVLYHNASTRFTDGGVFGMGAEIGISTQKLHVRGPFALEALTTTQYRVFGDGQIRI